jgi:hypothetical protein
VRSFIGEAGDLEVRVWKTSQTRLLRKEYNAMWLRGTEFRASVIEAGKIVVFIPTDSEGKKRMGVTIRLDNENDARIAAAWLPSDRIFYYHDVQGDKFEGGFLNERTEERIRMS